MLTNFKMNFCKNSILRKQNSWKTIIFRRKPHLLQKRMFFLPTPSGLKPLPKERIESGLSKNTWIYSRKVETKSNGVLKFDIFPKFLRLSPKSKIKIYTAELYFNILMFNDFYLLTELLDIQLMTFKCI